MFKKIICFVVASSIIIFGVPSTESQVYAMKSGANVYIHETYNNIDSQVTCYESRNPKSYEKDCKKCRNCNHLKTKFMNFCDVTEKLTKSMKTINIKRSYLFRIIVKCIDSIHDEQLSL